MERQHDNEAKTVAPSVNPGFAVFQLAKALTASEDHPDPAARERATRRIHSWQTILEQMLSPDTRYGSRTPFKDVPAWATLDVASGGFATGELLAGGPLQVYECEILARIPACEPGAERLALNRYFLSEAGLADLQAWLHTRQYNVRVPEEGALLTVAWLAGHGHAAAARHIIDAISPFFAALRFYPVPDYRSHHAGARVHVQDVGATLDSIRDIAPNKQVLAQKLAAHAWAPLYDRMIALFVETMGEDAWPCQIVPADWSVRAEKLLNDYAELDALDIPSKYRKPGSHYVQLHDLLKQCARSFDALTARDIGRIRLILKCSLAKRGLPFTPAHCDIRRRQQAYVQAPLHADIARLVEQRLAVHAPHEGLDNVEALKEAVSSAEANAMVPAGTAIPAQIQRKLDRCLNDTLDTLVRRGLVSSGEALAKVLPQMTSGLRSLGIADPVLRTLYAAIYRAFRRRRSLLLLDLQQQVRIEELPWVAAIEGFRDENPSSQATAKQALEDIVVLALTYFPHAILPNKLVRECRALATGAGMALPLVDELAADIFMGKFTGNFLEAARLAGGLLRGSLYAVYYQIDDELLDRLDNKPVTASRWWQRQGVQADKVDFAQLCAARASVAPGARRAAANGMIIEQQQILTTQNLAALVVRLDVRDALQAQWEASAKSCFRWIYARGQMKVEDRHAQLVDIKNMAYAWRQMIFYLSLMPPDDLPRFFAWADQFHAQQPPLWQKRFSPAFDGLKTVAASLGSDAAQATGKTIQRFLGWSTTRHWLLR